jgi:hypothetical protein
MRQPETASHQICVKSSEQTFFGQVWLINPNGGGPGVAWFVD